MVTLDASSSNLIINGLKITDRKLAARISELPDADLQDFLTLLLRTGLEVFSFTATKGESEVLKNSVKDWFAVFGKNFEEGHGVALDHHCLMLVQQAQAVTDQIALLNVADGRLLPRQRTLGDLDQLLHQRLAPAHGVDDAGAEYSSRRRSRLGHGGEGRTRGFQMQSYLT